MIEKKIIFPCDKSERELILQFYENNSVKSNKTKECLNLFDSIKKYIGQACQFRFEFLRARTILNTYAYQLKQSKYSTKDELNPDENEKMEELYENLIEFQTIANDNSEDKWEEIITEITTKLKKKEVRTGSNAPVQDIRNHQ